MMGHQSPVTRHRTYFKFILILLVSLYLCIFVAFTAYALNLDEAKIHFLKGDYKAAILEGEKLLANCKESDDIDELYYILGLSYLKDANFLRACDIFEIILTELKDSKFKEEAILGLGDVCFLKEDFARAKGYYKKLLSDYPDTKLKAQGYYRLAQVGFKTSDNQTAKEYLEKIKQDFPQNIEVRLNNNLATLSEIYYTVQVGSFSKSMNAQKLAEKLKEKAYPAYTEETASGDKVFYRVRVGKFKTRYEALAQEEKLIKEGFPTKIYP
jgi:outer membrane protein assembly factor BamD (BamD/ComL family)